MGRKKIIAHFYKNGIGPRAFCGYLFELIHWLIKKFGFDADFGVGDSVDDNT